MSEGCRVVLHPAGGVPASVRVAHGTPLIRAATRAGVRLLNLCANRGLCMTCAVVVEDGDGLSRPTVEEARSLAWIGAPAGVRLSCQADVVGDVTVRARVTPVDRDEYDPGELWWQ